MNEFLLMAIVIIYLVIAYVPISDASNAAPQTSREHSLGGGPEADANKRP